MMKLSDTKCLLDTNVLIAAVSSKANNHKKALAFLNSASDNLKLNISSQNLLELSSVLTQGYKIPKAQVGSLVISFMKDSAYEIIFPDKNTVEIFAGLLKKNSSVHPVDLFLAATALSHNINTIITNDRDFLKIKEIKVYNPFVES